MLKILSFVCNEHTCLLSDEANFASAFAYPFGLWISDFGLRIVRKKFFWQITQSVECRSVKANVAGSNPALSANSIADCGLK